MHVAEVPNAKIFDFIHVVVDGFSDAPGTPPTEIQFFTLVKIFSCDKDKVALRTVGKLTLFRSSKRVLTVSRKLRIHDRAKGFHSGLESLNIEKASLNNFRDSNRASGIRRHKCRNGEPWWQAKKGSQRRFISSLQG